MSRIQVFSSVPKSAGIRAPKVIAFTALGGASAILPSQFRRIGSKWGVIQNLVDAPMFVNSRASRIVQLADDIAYATFRRYESGDTSYFDIVASRFFERDGVLHGLAHKQPYDPFCMWPAA